MPLQVELENQLVKLDDLSVLNDAALNNPIFLIDAISSLELDGNKRLEKLRQKQFQRELEDEGITTVNEFLVSRRETKQREQDQENDGALAFSVDQAQRLFGQAIQTIGDATGIDALQKSGSEYVRKQDREIEQGGHVSSYEGSFLDQDNVGDALGYLFEAIAENAAVVVAAPIAAIGATLAAPASVAGIVAGGTALATGSLLGIGSVASELKEKGVYDADESGIAIAAGLVSGTLDALGAKVITQPLKKAIVGKLARSGVLTMVASDVAKTGVLKEASKGFVGEGVTETLQEGIEVLTAASEGAEYENDELVNRFVESFLVGAAVGGGLRGGTQGVLDVSDRIKSIRDKGQEPTVGKVLQEIEGIDDTAQPESIVNEFREDQDISEDSNTGIRTGESLNKWLDQDVEIVEAPSDSFFTRAKDALKWGLDNLRSLSYVNEETGIAISIQRPGLEKALSKNYDIIKGRALRVLPNLIQKATVSEVKKGPRPEDIKNDQDVFRFYSALNVDGVTFRVKITVKENLQERQVGAGRFYNYDLENLEIRKSEPLSSDSGSLSSDPIESAEITESGSGSFPENSQKESPPSDNTIRVRNLLRGVKSDSGVAFVKENDSGDINQDVEQDSEPPTDGDVENSQNDHADNGGLTESESESRLDELRAPILDDPQPLKSQFTRLFRVIRRNVLSPAKVTTFKAQAARERLDSSQNEAQYQIRLAAEKLDQSIKDLSGQDLIEAQEYIREFWDGQGADGRLQKVDKSAFEAESELLAAKQQVEIAEDVHTKEQSEDSGNQLNEANLDLTTRLNLFNVAVSEATAQKNNLQPLIDSRNKARESLSSDTIEALSFMRNKIDRLSDEVVTQSVSALLNTHQVPDSSLNEAIAFLGDIDNSFEFIVENNLPEWAAQIPQDELVRVGNQVSNILANRGEYVTRTYRIYSGGKAFVKWMKEHPSNAEIRKNALEANGGFVDRAKASNPNLSDAEAITQAKKDMNRFLESAIGIKDNAEFLDAQSRNPNGILKQRQDIPPEIRALMGEVTDPLLAYTGAITRMSELISTNRFYNQVFSELSQDISTEPSEGLREIRINEGVGVTNPFSGKFATPEVAGFIEAATNFTFDTGLMRSLYLTNTVWQKVKTVYSLPTISANMINGVVPMIASASFSPSAFNDSVRVLHKLYNPKAKLDSDVDLSPYRIDDISSQDFIKFMVENDLSRGSLTGEIDSYLRLGGVKAQSNITGNLIDFKLAPSDGIDGAFKKVGRGVVKTVKKADQLFSNLFNFGDAFPKSTIFLNEMEKMVALKNNPKYSKALPDSQLEMMEIAANTAKQKAPQYSRIPQIIDFIRKTPFVGMFVSFHSQMYQTVNNMMVESGHLMGVKSDNGKTFVRERLGIDVDKLEGSARSALELNLIKKGFVQGVAVISTIVGYGALMNEIVGGIVRTDDEEEPDREQMIAATKLLPHYYQFIDKAYTGKDKQGNPMFINTGRLNMYGGIREAMNVFNAMAQGDIPVVEGAAKLAGSASGGVFDQTIATHLIRATLNNKTQYNRQIIAPEDGWLENTASVFDVFFKEFTTNGTTRVISDTYNSLVNEQEYDARTGHPISAENAAGRMFGFNQIIFDAKRNTVNKLFEKVGDNRQLRTRLNGKLKSFAELSDLELTNDILSAKSEHEKIFKEIIEVVNAAKVFGVDEDALIEASSISRLGKKNYKDYISKGIAPPFVLEKLGKNSEKLTEFRNLSHEAKDKFLRNYERARFISKNL